MSNKDVAKKIIEENWNHDGAAVAETAERGIVSDADREDIATMLEEINEPWLSVDAVCAELVSACQALRG